MNETKTVKITIELDESNLNDRAIIEFIETETNKMKKVDVKAVPINKSDLVRILISKPTKTHEKKVKEAFLRTFGEADKLHAIYTGYNKSIDENLTLADFSLNHLGGIKNRERRGFIDAYLQ